MSYSMKTSISMPTENEQDWRVHRTRIFAKLPVYLFEFRRQNPRRIGLKQFSNCEAGLVRFNVYWDQETYSQLHAVAHALCMSVSHLLWQILMLVLMGGSVKRIFSNYGFQVKQWSSRALNFSEKLTFSFPRKGKRDAISSKNWHKMSLRFTA